MKQDANESTPHSQSSRPEHIEPCVTESAEPGCDPWADATAQGFFRTLFEKAAEGIVIVDPSTRRVVQVNPSFGRMFGYSEDRMSGMSVEELHPEETRSFVVSWFESHKPDFGVDQLATECVRCDGRRFLAELRVSMVEMGGQPYVVSFFTDITRRRRAEELMRAQRDLAQTLNITNDLASALKVCLTAVISASGMDAGGIYLVDTGTGNLDLVCSEGLPSDFVSAVAHYEANSPNARAVHSGFAIYHSYVQLSMRMGIAAANDQLRAIAVVPVKHDGRVIACLNVTSRVHDEVPELARNAIETMAESIGSAIVRIRAEQAVRDSENRFRELTAHINDAFWIISPTWDDVLYVSPAYERIWGRSCESLYESPMSWFKAIHEDDRDRVQARIAAFKRGGWGHTEQAEYRVVRPDGSVCWVRSQAHPVRDRLGEVVRVIGVSSDITEQRLAAHKLRVSEAKYREIFDTMQEGIAIINPDGVTVFANPAYAAILDEPGAEAVIGLSLADYLSASPEADALREAVGRPVDHREPNRTSRHELKIVTRQGHRKTVLFMATPRYDEKMRFADTIGLMVDITQVKQAESALVHSEARFRELTELLPQVVFELDSDGYIKYANRYGFEQLGFSPQSLDAGLHLLAVIAPVDRNRAMESFRTTLAGTKNPGHEYTMVRKDGTVFPALVYASPILRDGRIVGTRGVILDITEHKKSQTALRDSEERWHFALEGSGDGVWDWNALTNQVFFSRQWKAMLGYREDDIGSSLDEWSSRIHPDDLEVVFADIKRHFAGETPSYSSEHRLRCKDGSYRWILDRGKVVSWTSDGKPLRVIGTHTDITERKQAEVTLRDSQRRLTDVIGFLPDATFAIDRQGRVIVWNRAMEDISGVKAEDILNKGDYEYALPFYGQRRPILIDLALRKSEDIEKQYLFVETQGDVLLGEAEANMRGEARILWGKASPLYDNHGNVVGAIESVRDVTDHRRAEAALREREAKLGSIMAAAPIGIGIVSNRILQHVNRSFCEMTGYPEDELINRSVATLYYTGEEFDRVGREYGRITTQGVSAIETVWRRKDGTTIEVILNVTPLDRSDWSKGITFTALDITERKRAESDLRAAEEQYRVLFERAGEGIMVASGEYFVLANPAFCALCGYTLDDLVQLKIEDFIHPDHRAVVMERYRRRQEGEQVPTGYDFKIVTKNGETKWVKINSTIISWQGRHATLNFVEDITVSREAQEELRKFKTISDSATYGTAITDMHGTLVYVNEAFARMHGYRSDELLGGNLAVLHSDEQQRIFGRINEGLIRTGSFTSAEVWHRRRDGSVFPTLMNGVVIRDGSGQAQFLAATAADITELKRLQEFADRARRLEAAGRIAGQVAHDFNNLLGPLVAYPEFIKEEIGANHSANAYLDTMEAAAQQMADINQQLLSLGRRGHYNLEPLNLNEVIRQVLQQLQIQSERIEVITELSGDLMNIKAGAAQIVRVLTNLISNAVDAMQGAGTLHLSTQNWYADNPHGAYGQIEKGEYVKVTVSDSGCGIPQQIIGQVFEPFFTTKKADKKRGSGLGLSVVHAIVEDHGGYVDIESAEERGTSVYLYFPITREEQTTIGDNRIVGGGESILLVDDDRVQQEVTTRLLERLGYRVATVSSGEEAIQFIRRESVDLVLLDMIMPGGMDGVDTYRYLLEYRPGQKAIIVSGFAEGDRVAEARSLGAGEFLRKPLTLKSLAQTVRRELDRVPDLQPI